MVYFAPIIYFYKNVYKRTKYIILFAKIIGGTIICTTNYWSAQKKN